MPVSVVVIALSLVGSLGHLEEPSPSPLRLAQDEDRLEEDFGDPPPPPPLEPEGEEGVDPADPVGDAPALPPPTVEETPDAPRADDDDRDRDRDRDDDDEGGNPVLIGLMQYGAGFGTLAGCTAVGTTGICCGLVCINPLLTPFAFSLPLLGSCISAASFVALGAGSGAAAGAVEALIGDTFGEDDVEVGLLWPTVATAGTGAGLMALMGAASLGSAILTPTFGAPQPGNINFATPLSCLLSTTSLLLCGAFCVGTPIVGLLTYGTLASSAEGSQRDREVMLAPRVPAVALATPAMAF